MKTVAIGLKVGWGVTTPAFYTAKSARKNAASMGGA